MVFFHLSCVWYIHRIDEQWCTPVHSSKPTVHRCSVYLPQYIDVYEHDGMHRVLIPRPRPAFHCLQYEKSGETLRMRLKS